MNRWRRALIATVVAVLTVAGAVNWATIPDSGSSDMALKWVRQSYPAGPRPRVFASMAYDTATAQMVLFEGHGKISGAG